jgi:hypothetical protein
MSKEFIKQLVEASGNDVSFVRKVKIAAFESGLVEIASYLRAYEQEIAPITNEDIVDKMVAKDLKNVFKLFDFDTNEATCYLIDRVMKNLTSIDVDKIKSDCIRLYG